VIQRLKDWLPGLLLSGIIGTIAYVGWHFTRSSLQVSSLLWAFVISFALGNLVKLSPRFQTGIRFTSSKLLRVAVGMLGLAVSAAAWWKLGGAGIAVVMANLIITLLVGYIICRILLGMTLQQSMLIMTGTAICGASAIAATAPAVDANEQDTALALAVVTLFGLAAMVLYPLLYEFTPVGHWLANDPLAFGLWSGTGIHETAQVVASGSQIEGALEMATLAKSVRIFMIGPVVLLCAVLCRRGQSSGETSATRAIRWPWFALAFVAFTFAHMGLEHWLGDSWVSFAKGTIKPIVKFLLTSAFAAIGLRVRVADLRAIGAKAFAAGLLVATTAGVTAFLLTKLLWV